MIFPQNKTRNKAVYRRIYFFFYFETENLATLLLAMLGDKTELTRKVRIAAFSIR
jgi:hypothetical protein